MSDRESLAEAAKRTAREGTIASEAKRKFAASGGGDEEEGIEDCGAYGFLRGVRERALHLEIRQKKGTCLAPGYSWLLRPVYDPEGSIVLHYASGDRITIRGRNLRPIYDRILRHQVLWIEEQGQDWLHNEPDSLTVVYGIDYHVPEAENDG